MSNREIRIACVSVIIGVWLEFFLLLIFGFLS